MADGRWDFLDDVDDEDQQYANYTESLRDVILFAIDCSESMHSIEEDQKGPKSHLLSVLQAVIALQKRKVMYSPNDSVGILLFNTVERSAAGGKMSDVKDHIYIYQPVAQINAPNVLQLMELVSAAEGDPDHLRSTFRPWSKRVPMGDVFSTCNWVLRDGAPKAATKRVFLVTDEDSPHGGHVHMDTVAHNILEDLYALGVTIEPFFISTPNKPFDPTKAYIEILSRNTGSTEDNDNEDLQIIPDVVRGFGRLLEDMKIRETPKRALFSIPFILGDGFTIGIKGYGLVTSQKKGNYKYFVDRGRDGLIEASSRAVYFEDGTLNEGVDGQIVFGMSLGSGGAVARGEEDGAAIETEGGSKEVTVKTKVYYTAEDVKALRTFGMEPGLRLLGFKDSSELAFEDNIKHSQFIYPNEKAFTGSTRTFHALLKTMVAKEKIALCLGLFRRNSSPYFYAMAPQAETFNEDGAQEQPAGFHLIPLPYADDVRAAPIEKAYRASRELTKAAEAWIEKVTIKKGYQPDAYPNPALSIHYAQLEALAFEQEFAEDEFDDATAPKLEMIHKRTGPLVARWKELLNEDPNSNAYTATAGTKRKATTSIDEQIVRERFEAGALAKLTVDDLKAFCKAKNLSVKGKKADLVERVSEWLEVHK